MHIKNHFKELIKSASNINHEHIQSVVDIIYEAWQSKNRIYVIGTGGSASTAEHFASGLVKECGAKVFALTSAPIITAFSNDVEYKSVFMAQVRRYVEDGDVVVGISFGGSPNVIQALAWARTLHCKTILIAGWMVKESDRLYNVLIKTDTMDIMVAEDLHLAICHSIEKEVRQLIENERDA